jgi:predicted nucleotidyltransferase
MDKETDLIIREYREKLLEVGINPERIIVFGAHAAGTATDDTILDLLIIASDFKKMDLWERMSLLGQARMDIKVQMNILGVTSREAEDPDIGAFLRFALENGVEVS